MNETNQELIDLKELAKKETPAVTEVTINERRIKNGLKPIPGGSEGKRMNLIDAKYKEFLERSQSEIDSLKEELINLVKSEGRSYGNIERFLELSKKKAIWENNLVLIEVINEVIDYFGEEKNGLSVK